MKPIHVGPLRVRLWAAIALFNLVAFGIGATISVDSDYPGGVAPFVVLGMETGPTMGPVIVVFVLGSFLISLLILTGYAAYRLTRFARDCARFGRSAQGLCGACGYDLRARMKRCPECGIAAY